MGRRKKNEYDSTEEVVEEVEETVEETVDPEETAEAVEENEEVVEVSEEEASISDEEEPEVVEPEVVEPEPVVEEPVVQEPVQEEVKVAIPVEQVESYVARCVVCKHTQIENKPIEHVTCAACGSGNVKVR